MSRKDVEFWLALILFALLSMVASIIETDRQGSMHTTAVTEIIQGE